MDFTYTLEAKHFVDFSIASTRELAHVNGLKGQIFWGVIVGTCVAVAGAATRFIIDADDPMIFWMFVSGAWFFWLINYMTTIYVVRRSSSLAFGKEGLILGSRRLSINDDGLHLNSNLFSQDVRWKAIHSISVQHLVVVLWTETASGIFIPRSTFATSEKEQNFVSFVQSNIRNH